MSAISRSGFLQPVSFVLVLAASLAAPAQNAPLEKQVNSVFPDAQALYLDLHQHPELSSH